MPLLAGLLDHLEKGYHSYHTPGHKQGEGAFSPWRQLLGKRVFELDLTELSGLDNLQDPQGIIRAGEAEAARYFGAKETFFLVNGATAGILAVLLAKSGPRCKVVLSRASHQSVIHGIILSGAEPVYLPVSAHEDVRLPGQVLTDDLGGCLETLGEEALIVLVHPNYYGLVGDLEEQVQIARKYGCRVLVDEAHGAHFGTSDDFPDGALALGADFAVHGTHKVLGSFTQSAFLHCGSQGDPGGIREALRMVQSSSPSYLLMASLDVARGQCELDEEGWLSTALLGEGLRREISQIPGLWAAGEELLKIPGVKGYDPARLVVQVRGLGITGFQAAEWLEKEYGILVEMADLWNIVFILVPADIEDAAKILLEGLAALSRFYEKKGKEIPSDLPDPLLLPLPEQVLTPREAYFAKHTFLPWAEALGKISGELITPYPPGVPLLCPGEKISGELLDFLGEWKSAGGVWPGKDSGLFKIVTGS